MKVTVYTKPQCVQCEWTKKQLDRLGVTYESFDVTTDPEAREAVQHYATNGEVSMPVVVVTNGAHTTHWCGFKIGLIRGLKDVGDR